MEATLGRCASSNFGSTGECDDALVTCELVSGYHDQLGQGEDLHMNGASWKIGHRNRESPNVD